MKKDKDIVLYLLSRNDLPSMTAGKEMAQAQHAGVQLIAKHGKTGLVKRYIEQGLAQGADHFNTTICLDAGTGENIKYLVSFVQEYSGYNTHVSDLVIDPTYPYWVDAEVAEVNNLKYEFKKDNKVLMLRKELTFGYILCYKDSRFFSKLLGNLPLKQFNPNIYREK